MSKVHQFIGEAQPPVCSEHRKRCDMSSQLIGIRFIVHFRKDISAYLSILFGDVEKFGPSQVVVEIVVEVVVFRKAP